MSEIRSILLHLDATPGSTGRLALAHALADRHDARVTALFGVRPDPGQASFAYSAGAALQAAEELATAADIERERLRMRAAERDPECTWCDVVGDSLLHGFVAESAYADLLILGAPGGNRDGGGPPPGFVESVILQSGTPALLVPQPHRQETIGECVLVAWNGSPQAARALKAALPLLHRAAQVHVASWARQPPGAPFSGVDARWWLQRHGIDARVHRRDPAAHVDEGVRALASELAADLVVMGSYGRSRIREQVFGGVTRGLLARLPAPVLMAH
jgi:nucleotide-binding universal stress UspA family protein